MQPRTRENGKGPVGRVPRGSAARPLTHGEARRGLSTQSFRLLETRHPQGMCVADHTHDRACINIVLEGCYAEQTSAGAGSYGPLTTLFKPAGESHANHFRYAGSRCLLLEGLEDEAFQEPFGQDPGRPRTARDPALAALGLRLWYELATPDDQSALSVDELAGELYVRALGDRGGAWRESARVARVVDLLHESRARWTLSGLASEVGTHRSHLARAFRAQHGRTIGEYQRELRVARVARALATGGGSIAALADAAGFSDQSHCTRAFRRVLGTTPAMYRRIVGG